MRIAVSLDTRHTASSQADAADDGWSTGAGRLLLLPAASATVSALAEALELEAGSDRTLVLYPGSAPMEQAELVQAEELELHPRGDERIEGVLARAAALYDARHLDAAFDAYASADSLMSEEASPRRAEALMCMAELELLRGRQSEGALLLDRALAFFPLHRSALRARLDLAVQAGDSVMTAALRHRTVGFAESDSERSAALEAVANDCLLAATDALARALALRPRDQSLLSRLRAIHEASGRYEHAVNVSVMLAESLPDAGARARTLVAAAELCREKLGNTERAVALFEAAIADDPAIAGAFEAIEAVLLGNEDWQGAEKAYARQLDRLVERGLRNEQKVLLRKLSQLRDERLGDTTGAILALDRLVTLDPHDLAARHKLATMLEQAGQPDLAMRCLEVTAKLAPTEPATFQAIHRVAARTGDADRAYSACSVLVHLGEADIDEQMTYQQFAPESSLPALHPFDDDAWTLIQPEDHDRAMDEVMRAIEPAAVAIRVEELQAASKLAAPSAKELQVPESSTLSAVRMVQWAARLLGLETPQIVARGDDIPGGMMMLAARKPTVLLGKALLSGRSVPELAFSVTRELAYLRAAGQLPIFYRSMGEVRALVLAAVEMVVAEGPRSRGSASMARGLQERLSGSDKLRLAEGVEALMRGRGQVDLTRWWRTVELASCRAALLAADDITVAARMLAVDGRASAGLSASDRVRDLSGYSVSQRYFALRRLLGAPARGAQAS